MKSIQTIPEARKAMAEVKETVGAVEEFFARFERMFQGSSGELPTPSKASVNGNSPMPPTFIDRVSAILAEATKPMRPKTAVKEYLSRGWPLPGKKADPSELYNNVCGALIYMRKHRKSVDRNDDGYFLKNAKFARHLT
jgi:hypothetical protein